MMHPLKRFKVWADDRLKHGASINIENNQMRERANN